LRVQPKLLVPRTPSKPNRVMRLSVAVGSQLPARLLPLISQPKRWTLMILLAQLASPGARLPSLKRPTMATP
jgi:hypothetical protein